MTFGNSTCVTAVAGVVCYGVFYNYKGSAEHHAAIDCASAANYNSDISGIGVVISFAASAIITTAASIIASLLDHVASRRNSILPAKWQPNSISGSLRERCVFLRRVLDRTIISFADQQLVTGFALLIATWVKLHTNPVLTGEWKYWETFHFPNFWLPNAQFSLVVFLCMASSSSHLSCVLVLREYMEDHKSAAKLRLTLIVIFATFLAVTIALASSLTSYFAYIIVNLFNLTVVHNKPLSQKEQTLILATCIAIPLVVIMGVCWLCILQSVPKLKENIQTKIRSILLKRLRRWFKLSTIWHSGIMRLLPKSWRKPCTQIFKRGFWFLLVGNEFAAFIIQIILAIVSLVWIGLQRMTKPPHYLSYWDEGTDLQHTPLCSLHGVAGASTLSSFGQLLPVILLLQPLLGAYGSYVEERDKARVTGYAGIPEWESSPTSRKRTVRRPTGPHRDDSETGLLDAQSGRHESSGSLGSSPFSRVYHTGHESQGSLHAMYTIGEVQPHVPGQPAFASPEIVGLGVHSSGWNPGWNPGWNSGWNSGHNSGYNSGWAPGFSTGYSDQQHPTGRSSRW